MPQDFNYDATTMQAMSPQRLENLRKAAKERGEVFPYETTTVYATQQAVDRKIPGVTSVGHAFVDVHVNVAEKLIAAGKATKEKPETLLDKSERDKKIK